LLSLHSFPTRRSSDLFAVRMATRAVRTGDPGYVLLGLRALALETDPDDPRDFFVAVGPLYRASELIGARAAPLFDEAAGFTASEDRKSTRLNSSHRTI